MLVMRWGTGTLNHKRVKLTDRILGGFWVRECPHFNPVGQSSGKEREAERARERQREQGKDQKYRNYRKYLR